MLTIRRTAGDWPLSSPKMYRPLQKAPTPGKSLDNLATALGQDASKSFRNQENHDIDGLKIDQ